MKILTFLSFVLFCGSFYSQDYKPLLQEGNKWHVVFSDGAIQHHCLLLTQSTQFVYRIEGESVVNGKTYKRILYDYVTNAPERRRSCNKTEDNSYINNFAALLREDVAEKKVYKNVPGTNDEVLLYDFSLSTGSVFDGSNLEVGEFFPTLPLVVQNVFQGHVFDMNIKAIGINDELYLYEGIGSPNGLLEYLNPPNFEYGNRLVCFENTSGISCNSTLATEKPDLKKNINLFYAKDERTFKIINGENVNYSVQFFDTSGKLLDEVKAKTNQNFSIKTPVKNALIYYVITSGYNIWKGSVIIP